MNVQRVLLEPADGGTNKIRKASETNAEQAKLECAPPPVIKTDPSCVNNASVAARRCSYGMIRCCSGQASVCTNIQCDSCSLCTEQSDEVVVSCCTWRRACSAQQFMPRPAQWSGTIRKYLSMASQKRPRYRSGETTVGSLPGDDTAQRSERVSRAAGCVLHILTAPKVIRPIRTLSI